MTVTMFDDEVASILSRESDGASTSEKLLLAPTLKYTIKNDVVVSCHNVD